MKAAIEAKATAASSEDQVATRELAPPTERFEAPTNAMRKLAP